MGDEKLNSREERNSSGGGGDSRVPPPPELAGARTMNMINRLTAKIKFPVIPVTPNCLANDLR